MPEQLLMKPTSYELLLLRCRRTLDLSPMGPEGLRDFEKIIARNCLHQGTALALYACLYRNLVEYIEQQSAAPERDK